MVSFRWMDKSIAAALLTALLLAGCGGAEERKAKYQERAIAYFEENNFDKARIEFKNVLQIDPKTAAPYYYLGRIAEEEQQWRKAFGSYSKAVELADEGAEVDENDFRYLGPRPQSKETALVMLADGCEAAVRAARPTSAEGVAEIVDRVISKRADDGQLSASGLTLRDLEIVSEVFSSALKGVYHPRITYPPQAESAPAAKESS